MKVTLELDVRTADGDVAEKFARRLCRFIEEDLKVVTKDSPLERVKVEIEECLVERGITLADIIDSIFPSDTPRSNAKRIR